MEEDQQDQSERCLAYSLTHSLVLTFVCPFAEKTSCADVTHQ
jgi:hypothetical protein